MHRIVDDGHHTQLVHYPHDGMPALDLASNTMELVYFGLYIEMLCYVYLIVFVW